MNVNALQSVERSCPGSLKALEAQVLPGYMRNAIRRELSCPSFVQAHWPTRAPGGRSLDPHSHPMLQEISA
jgi:hypothetical protein